MSDTDTILITGAAGRTSGFVIRALLAASVPPTSLRLLVRSDASAAALRARHPALAPASFVTADYLEARTLAPALAGVRTVFHNGPMFHPAEAAMGTALVDAALAAGVRHFVYCSVLLPILTKLLNHAAKLRVEEYLVESGLEYTILQPTTYMQNIPLARTLATGELPAYYTPSTLQGFLALEDLAAAAALVLREGAARHARARYELVGENATFDGLARALARVAAREVRVERADGPDHVPMESAYAVEAMDRMLFYYDRRGIPGNNNTLRWLLGREPTSWEDFIRRAIQEQ